MRYSTRVRRPSATLGRRNAAALLLTVRGGPVEGLLVGLRVSASVRHGGRSAAICWVGGM
ncbi:hypothetical protein C8Q79DRAFT_970082 [Trametes meyenii]|nr:hypothetical protein C8Q79DRAFT_970082 [Trametes meyenii]